MAKSDRKFKSYGFLNLKTCEIMLIIERLLQRLGVN